MEYFWLYHRKFPDQRRPLKKTLFDAPHDDEESINHIASKNLNPHLFLIVYSSVSICILPRVLSIYSFARSTSLPVGSSLFQNSSESPLSLFRHNHKKRLK